MHDKRDLKRQYLEAPTRAGVLAIRHLPSGRLLVDGSPNAQAALNRHAFELRMGQHRNLAMQHDWNRDGEAGFSFDVLDVLTPSDDPAGDTRRELQALLSLWCEEMGVSLAGVYGQPVAGPGADPQTSPTKSAHD
jgi:hypothetical protein